MRSKRGPKTKLSKEEEELMHMYLQECWAMDVPQDEKHFRQQVAHYMSCNKTEVTFKNVIPGLKLDCYPF